MTFRMMVRVVSLLSCGAALAVFVSCDRDYGLPPGPDDYNTVEIISYSRHVQPIFARRCATSGCHDTQSAEEDLIMDSWESVMRGSENGAMVVPFRPEKSHLIFHVNTDTTVAPVAEPRMPPDAPLAKDEVAFLMRWIREGAKNDLGQVPFFDVRSGKILVTNQADDEVAIIDVESNMLMRMVSVGSLDNRTTPPEAPHNLAVDPQLQSYYVNMIVSNEILKYRARDNVLLGKLNLGEKASPAQIALSRDGTTGYVTNFDITGTNRSIQVFNTQTMEVTRRISDQRMIAPHGITRSRSGETLWIACQQSDNIGIVDMRDPDEVTIVKVDSTVPDIPIGAPRFGPYQLVFTPDGRFAYVTCRFSNDVRVFDTQTTRLVSVIPVGVNPLILQISPDGSLLYVANRGTGAAPSRTVSVVDTRTNREFRKIQNVGAEPHGVAVSSSGRFVYVACENVGSPDEPHHPVKGLNTPGIVAVIDINRNFEVIKRIEVGAFAAGIVFFPTP